MLINYFFCFITENRDSHRMSSSKSLIHSVGYLEHLENGREATSTLSTTYQTYENWFLGGKKMVNFYIKKLINIEYLNEYTLYLKY